MQNHATNGQNHRSHPRQKYEVEVVFYQLGRIFRASMKNLSLGGAYLETCSVNQFTPGEVVAINLPAVSKEKMIKLNGRIKWQNNVGFAVEFI